MLGHQRQRIHLVGHSGARDPLHPGEWPFTFSSASALWSGLGGLELSLWVQTGNRGTEDGGGGGVGHTGVVSWKESAPQLCTRLRGTPRLQDHLIGNGLTGGREGAAQGSNPLPSPPAPPSRLPQAG